MLPTALHMFTDEQARLHVHDHTGITSCNREHCHTHPGVTGPPIPSGDSHIHEIRGATTYDQGHSHVYYATTRPAVMLPGGQHTHQAIFRTSFNFGHDHVVDGYVMAAPSSGHTHQPGHHQQQSPMPYHE